MINKEIEEAKNILKEYRFKEIKSVDEIYNKAVDTAIKVLEKELDEAVEVDPVIKILEQEPSVDTVSINCEDCVYYDNGANDEACDGCFEDEEHLNFKPKAQYCEDCISRQAVLEVLKKNRYRFNISQEGYCEGKVLWSENLIKDDACKEIEQLPSVTPKEKIGHWIGHREHCEKLGLIPSGLGAYKWCSNCDCGIDINEWYINHYNFCPNCGARMVSE